MFHVKWRRAEDDPAPAEEAGGAEDAINEELTISSIASGGRTKPPERSCTEKSLNLPLFHPFRRAGPMAALRDCLTPPGASLWPLLASLTYSPGFGPGPKLHGSAASLSLRYRRPAFAHSLMTVADYPKRSRNSCRRPAALSSARTLWVSRGHSGRARNRRPPTARGGFFHGIWKSPGRSRPCACWLIWETASGQKPLCSGYGVHRRW